MKSAELESLIEIINRLLEEEAAHPAFKAMPPDKVREGIDLRIPEHGKGIEEVFRLAEEVVLRTPRTGSRRFFNQLFGGRYMPAVAGEMLAAVLNSSMYTYKVAGIQILIEKEILSFFCERVGFADGDGILVPGGSMSNLVAMTLGRNEKRSGIRNHGLSGEMMTAYASDQSHYSLVKNAGILGIGRENVRLVGTDERGRMLVDELVEAIEADLAHGAVPFFVCATAGTTVLGAFDPIADIAAVAGEYGLWFHVDGAFGGTLLLSSGHRHFLAGCDLADSFSWNAHKMMSVPLAGSAILVKQSGMLNKHLSEDAHYLFQTDGEDLNPGQKSIQCGRRNDALKIWMALQSLGLRGYEQRIRQQFDLAKYASDRIAADDELELECEPESVTVCFNVRGAAAEVICEQLDLMGLGKVGYGSFRDRTFVRMVFVDPEITYADIDGFLSDIKTVGRQVRQQAAAAIRHP